MVSEKIIREISVGNEEAFNYVYNYYYKHLYNWANKILNAAYLEKKVIGYKADDVLVEVFSDFWKHRARFKESNEVHFYLLTSVRNRCFNKIRDEKTYRIYNEKGSLVLYDNEVQVPDQSFELLINDTSFVNRKVLELIYNMVENKLKKQIVNIKDTAIKFILKDKFKGRVVTKNGEPLAFGKVLNIRTCKTAITDRDGKFVLEEVNPSDTLVLSYSEGLTSKNMKDCFFLFYYEEKSAIEIAKILNVSRQSVQYNLKKGRRIIIEGIERIPRMPELVKKYLTTSLSEKEGIELEKLLSNQNKQALIYEIIPYN